MAVNVIRTRAIPTGEVDVSWMPGHSIQVVAFSEPHHWAFTLTGGGVLTTEGLWRVLVGERLAVTSEDHRQRFGLDHPLDVAAEVSRAVSSEIVEALIDPGTSDLTVRFEGRVELQLLVTSMGYEAWQLETPDGRGFVVSGSGTASTWGE